MKLNFKETTTTEPSKWFQLHIDDIETKAYWPTKTMVEWHLGMSDLTCCCGLDIETEAYAELYETFIQDWPMFAETPGLTRLQLCFAVKDIMQRLRSKLHTLERIRARDALKDDAIIVYHEKRPAETGSYEPKPFNNL